MPFLSSQAFAALHERAARAEARADAAELSASVSDARFDRLFLEYTALRQKGADPVAAAAPVERPVALPEAIDAELREFLGDSELYAHNRRYAEMEMARGTDPQAIATAIRFGARGQEVTDRGEGDE